MSGMQPTADQLMGVVSDLLVEEEEENKIV
jgi:hypothetical protein